MIGHRYEKFPAFAEKKENNNSWKKYW